MGVFSTKVLCVRTDCVMRVVPMCTKLHAGTKVRTTALCVFTWISTFLRAK